MSLENRISKAVVEYIDTAITTPPVHQPFQDADKLYDSFVKDFARLSAGIDMKQVYQRKPGDPSYLPSDNFAINLARLFLAFRVREQVPLALRPQPERPLSLGSVDLAKVTEKTFDRVLFLIANANERAAGLNRHRPNPLLDRAYEEFKQVASRLPAEPYVRKSDDPHWLVRYSVGAINTVRAMVAIQARLRSEQATGQSAQPIPVPSLDSVDLKDIPHPQFVEILHGAFFRAMRGRHRVPAPAPAPQPTPTPAPAPAVAAPLSTDSCTDIESGSDTCYEPDSDDQYETAMDSDGYGDDSDYSLDSDEEIVDDGDDTDEDAGSDNTSDDDLSSDEEEMFIIPQKEMVEPDDFSVFASEEDYQREFKQWNDNEADEPLPRDVIGPLLNSTDEETRSFTIGLLQMVLGVAKAPITEMKKNIEIVLRELRRLYRIAHTRPWRYSSVPEYERTVTPFVYCYSVLSDTVYMMRSLFFMIFKAPEMVPEMPQPAEPSLKAALESLRKDLRRMPKTLEGLPDCQRIMAERARITRVRSNAYFDALNHITGIMTKFEKAFTITQTSPRHRPEFNVKHHYGLDLRTAVQNFAGFDNSRLGMEYFPEFPAALVKDCKILVYLDKVYGLKFIPEFQKNEDIMKAANIAGELFRKWHQRSLQSRNSFFVVLQ